MHLCAWPAKMMEEKGGWGEGGRGVIGPDCVERDAWRRAVHANVKDRYVLV